MTIDQTDATDYRATLKATGTVTVKFAPSQIFKDSNPDLAVFDMKYKLKTDNTAPLAFTATDGEGERELFTKFDTTTTTDLSLAKQTDDTYQATFNAEDILSLITINTFKLDAYDEYVAFSTKIGTFGNIGIEVDEA